MSDGNRRRRRHRAGVDTLRAHRAHAATEDLVSGGGLPNLENAGVVRPHFSRGVLLSLGPTRREYSALSAERVSAGGEAALPGSPPRHNDRYVGMSESDGMLYGLGRCD